MDALLSLLDFLPESFNSFKPFIVLILSIVAGVIVFATFMKSSGFIINSIKSVISTKKSEPLARKNPPVMPKKSPIIPQKQVSLFEISDDEFLFIDHLLKTNFDFKRDYIPVSKEQKIACNKLTNRGVFDKNADGSYKLTQVGINMIFAPPDSQ